jgi:hypothetical protein
VENILFDDGCTIADLIEDIANSASSHGSLVSAVAHLTNELKGDGLITGSEKAGIQSCAAAAALP